MARETGLRQSARRRPVWLTGWCGGSPCGATVDSLHARHIQLQLCFAVLLVLLQLAIERAAVDSENLGSVAAVTVARLQDIEDVLALQTTQVPLLVARALQQFALGAGLLTQRRIKRD